MLICICILQDPVRCQDTATATPHLQAADSYEEHQHDYPIAPQCNERKLLTTVMNVRSEC